MLVVDANSGQPIQGQECLYRDMGGVNSLMTGGELATLLPEPLRDESFFYFDTHIKDAAVSIEDHFFQRTLFNFTKQFVKSERYTGVDPEFRAWKEGMEAAGLLVNWTAPAKLDDSHQEALELSQFCYYGYVAKLFARVLMAEIDRKGVFRTIARSDPYIFSASSRQVLLQRIHIREPRRWFHTLLFDTYTCYLESTRR